MGDRVPFLKESDGGSAFPGEKRRAGRTVCPPSAKRTGQGRRALLEGKTRAMRGSALPEGQEQMEQLSPP